MTSPLVACRQASATDEYRLNPSSFALTSATAGCSRVLTGIGRFVKLRAKSSPLRTSRVRVIADLLARLCHGSGLSHDQAFRFALVESGRRLTGCGEETRLRAVSRSPSVAGETRCAAGSSSLHKKCIT